MTFPYIDISYIYDEIRSLLKKMNVQGEINDDDCRAWSFSAVRLIGATNFEDATEPIEIKKSTGFIPKDFYTIKSLRYRGDSMDSNISALVNLGDSKTKSLFCKDSDNFDYSQPHVDIEVTIRNPPGVVRTNFYSGFLELTYFRLARTEKGDLMAEDEENNIQAIKYYIISQLLFEKMLLNEIPRNTWDLIDTKYISFRDKAKQILKFPDPSRLGEFITKKDKRYDDFKLNIHK
jgi:hypothetical protein